MSATARLHVCDNTRCTRLALLGAKRCREHLYHPEAHERCVKRGCDAKRPGYNLCCRPHSTEYNDRPDIGFVDWLAQSALEGPMADPKQPQQPQPQPTLTKVLTADAQEAALRLAAKQLVKLTREPLVALLSRHFGSDSAAKTFLDSELGKLVLTSLLSLALPMLPKQVGELPGRLSQELRIAAMAEAGDMVADVIMGPLREVISTHLQGVLEDNQSAKALEAKPAPERFAETAKVPAAEEVK